MAAGDPLAQFRPVSLHPSASLLHPAASCVTSPATLGHPRLQRPPLLHRSGAPTPADALPHPFGSRRKCGGGREGRRRSSSSPLLAPRSFGYPPSSPPRAFSPCVRPCFMSSVTFSLVKSHTDAVADDEFRVQDVNSFGETAPPTSVPQAHSKYRRNVRPFREITPWFILAVRKLHFYCRVLLPGA